jgi:hypothetical protein
MLKKLMREYAQRQGTKVNDDYKSLQNKYAEYDRARRLADDGFGHGRW